MVKRFFFCLLCAVCGMTAQAQETAGTAVANTTAAEAPAKMFGFLSYDAAMQSLPAYTKVQESIAQMRASYEAELKRVEEDFNKKYEEFLDGQKNFPKTILQKRQSELQEMLDKNIAFKKESQRMLADSEASMKKELRATVAAAVAKIAQERGYAFVVNTDADATPWMSPVLGEDISEAVKAALQQ